MDAGLLEVGKRVPAAGVLAVLEVLPDQRECLHFAGGQPTRLAWEAS
jgi:hypothetical protein